MKNTIEPRCELVGNQLYLEGFVMKDGDEGYISAAKVRKALSGAKGDIIIHVNSPGGFTTEGVAIQNILKDYSGHVTVQIDGIAAGAAVVFAMGADTIRARRSSMMMLQDPWDIAVGSADEIRAMANRLTIQGQSARRSMMKRFKGTEKELSSLMENDTYLPTDEAYSYGLIDEIIIDDAKSLKTRSQMKKIQAETKSFFHRFNRGE